MRKILKCILLIIFIMIFILSSYNIINWIMYNKKTERNITIISKNIYFTNDVINLNKLKNINEDVAGYIKVYDTKIDYPYVKTDNNSFYLTHSFDKTYNKAGWVFMDYRNNINFEDQNTILYAHGRLDKTMFGSLRDTLKDDWNKIGNNIILTSDGINNYKWKIFSIYKINTTDDYIKLYFNDDELQKLKNRSIYNFNTDIDNEDKILTLSTCYDSKRKIVIHAKMIKTAN